MTDKQQATFETSVALEGVRGHAMNADPVIRIASLGGNCPVQAEGSIDGKPFYFRARGNSWRMNIGGDDPVMRPDWTYWEEYGDQPYVAGGMPKYEALGFIAKSVGLYAARETGE